MACAAESRGRGGYRHALKQLVAGLVLPTCHEAVVRRFGSRQHAMRQLFVCLEVAHRNGPTTEEGL